MINLIIRPNKCNVNVIRRDHCNSLSNIYNSWQPGEVKWITKISSQIFYMTPLCNQFHCWSPRQMPNNSSDISSESQTMMMMIMMMTTLI